jgi:hypothetical protein
MGQHFRSELLRFFNFVHRLVFWRLHKTFRKTGSVYVLRWDEDTCSVGSLRKSYLVH